MNIDFPLILVIATTLCGLIWLIDNFFFMPKRKRLALAKAKQDNQPDDAVVEIKLPVLVEYARSFFPVLLIVLIIRSFIVQPFRVPSGSLEPTIVPGDFIAVEQFSYGLRLPVLGTKILSIGEPKRGDIAVFHWPINPGIDFVKRVIGLPGDHIVYKNKVLYINGKEANQKILGTAYDVEPFGNIPSMKIQENLNGVQHDILVHTSGGETGDYDFIVPQGYYFMMGDNRDDSNDSRYWGFVPEKDLVGRAFMIWMSWDGKNHEIRWDRIGKRLN